MAESSSNRSLDRPQLMSSSSDPMTERLLCSICLDVFSDPVSTPCGHNFCKICLSTYWNNSQDCRCPNCKETFKQRPDLKINTTLRDLVDEHKKKCHEEQAEVVCDICSEGKLKAVKSCLVCQSSYCETHLEPHLRVSGLQKHKRIDPVKNLQDYICQKHDRPLELFCRDDHTRVCLSCADGDHKNHNTVPITESELQEMMEEKQRGTETHDEYVIKYLEQEISEMKKRNIKLQMIAEKQRAAETRDKCLIKDLKKEITEIQRRNNELEMVKQKQITAENVIKVRDQEITELKKRNTELKMRDAELEMKDAELVMVKQMQITAENLIKVQDQEITELKKRDAELRKRDAELKKRDAELRKRDAELKKRNTELRKRDAELVMEKQKQITAENVIKVRDQEITELKKRDAELKMRDAELVMVKQKQITAENVIKVRDQEIAELKKRNTELKMRDAELVMVKQKQITAENVIKVRDQEITELKKRNTELRKTDAELRKRDAELVMVLLKQKTAERQYEYAIRDRDQEITELKKREAELVMVKQKQKIAENVIKVRDQEITELKKRNTEQQQKISNAENNLHLIQGKHQEYLSHQQKSSSEHLCSRIIGIVLLVLFIIASVRLELLQKEFTELQMRNGDLETDMLRCKAVRLEFTELQKRNGDLETDMLLCKAELHLKWMQQYAVDVTLDPDTAHPELILSDDEKQVRHGDIRHKLPDNPKRFDTCVNVLGKVGFSSGRFYYEVQVKGKTAWILGAARESDDRKGEIALTPDDGFWTVILRNKNEYDALADPSVSLSLRVKPQKVGVFVDYEEGLVSFYDVENRSHIYSYTDQSFTEKLYPYFSPCLNDEGKNSEPLIITPVIK